MSLDILSFLLYYVPLFFYVYFMCAVDTDNVYYI